MTTRRSVLLGLGGLIATGGAVVGSGAFSSVQAERTVAIETTGDANALLGFADPIRTSSTSISRIRD